MDHPLLQLLIGSTAPPKPLPPNASYKLRYELWLRDNHKWLLPMLDTLRSLTLFLPGRFQEGGALHSEALYTSLNLLSVFHDALLDQPRALTAELKMDPRGKTAAWAQVAQHVLLTAHYTEVLVEMAAKKYLPASPLLPLGSQSRRSWLVLCAVEALKAYCRLSLLYLNRGRMLTPPSNEDMILSHMSSIRAKQKSECKTREKSDYEAACKAAAGSGGAVAIVAAQQMLLDSPSSASASSSSSSSSSALLLAASSTPQCDTSLLPIPGDALPPNSSFSPFALQAGHLPPLQVQNLLDLYVRAGRQQAMDSTLGRPHGRFVTQTLHAHDSPSFVPPASEVVSEVLHLIRPIVYTAARAAWDQQPNSWTPWILSLAVDAASRALAPRLSTLSPAEFTEVLSRTRGYFFYLLRDPCFSNVMAAPLARLNLLLLRLPLLGPFLSSLVQLVFSIQRYYFYTSAS